MGKGSGTCSRPALRVSVRDGVAAAATFKASRSSGPGGQHANVTASKIVASVEVADLGFDEERLELALERLGERVSAVSQDARSQYHNRQQALDRLVEKIERAMHVDPPRVETKPSKAAVARARAAKERQSAKKRDRRWASD